ncbi:MAG: hypothetical protein AB7N65_00525 [Vicinamibacterales bacterium]
MSVRRVWQRLRTERRQQIRLARLLWVVLAVVVWHVVFDRVIVLAGRTYVHAAATAFQTGQPPVLMAPWMAAARARGVRLASAAAVPTALLGLLAVHLASRGR